MGKRSDFRKWFNMRRNLYGRNRITIHRMASKPIPDMTMGSMVNDDNGPETFILPWEYKIDDPADYEIPKTDMRHRSLIVSFEDIDIKNEHLRRIP